MKYRFDKGFFLPLETVNPIRLKALAFLAGMDLEHLKKNTLEDIYAFVCSKEGTIEIPDESESDRHKLAKLNREIRQLHTPQLWLVAAELGLTEEDVALVDDIEDSVTGYVQFVKPDYDVARVAKMSPSETSHELLKYWEGPTEESLETDIQNVFGRMKTKHLKELVELMGFKDAPKMSREELIASICKKPDHPLVYSHVAHLIEAMGGRWR